MIYYTPKQSTHWKILIASNGLNQRLQIFVVIRFWYSLALS